MPAMHPRPNTPPPTPQTPAPALPSTADLGGTIAPVAFFLVANRMGGLRAGIAAATVAAVAVAISRRQRGIAIGRLMPLTTAAIVVRGVVGIITDSEVWYFGLGIAAKFAASVALAASIAARRPLADYAAAALMRPQHHVRSHPVWLRTMAIVTAIAAIYFCAAGFIDIWLYRRNSVEGFVLLRFVANWPLGAAAIATAAWVCSRQLPKVPGIGPLGDLLNRDQTPQ